MKNWNAPGIRPRVASCSSRAPLLWPWLSRSRCRSRPTPRRVTPPPVPADIEVPAGNMAFLEGTPSAPRTTSACPAPTRPRLRRVSRHSGFAWLLFTPQATLFDDHDKQVTTHFFSPNPFENGTVRATWQHSRDTSTVWGGRAIRLLRPRLRRAGCHSLAPASGGRRPRRTHRGDTLTETTFIQRREHGWGVAPSTGCAQSTDVGTKAFVPYTADYFFYTDHRDTDHR